MITMADSYSEHGSALGERAAALGIELGVCFDEGATVVKGRGCGAGGWFNYLCT